MCMIPEGEVTTTLLIRNRSVYMIVGRVASQAPRELDRKREGDNDLAVCTDTSGDNSLQCEDTFTR